MIEGVRTAATTLLALLVGIVGCGAASAGPDSRPGAAVGQSASLTSPAVATKGPQGGEPMPDPVRSDATPGHFEALEVPDWGDAVLWVPPGRGRRPVLVAGHGAGGTPEAHCHRWSELVGDRGFVLCTRGLATNRHLPPEQRGYFYDGHHELGRETLAAVDALAARHARADVEGAVYAGYSQGATMGVLFLHKKADYGARFPRVVLIEGGSSQWNVPLSAQFAKGTGARVLFVCGQKRCRDEAERSARFLERAGVGVRVRYASSGGHTYLGEVGQEVEQHLPWLLASDPRWGAGLESASASR